MRQPRSRKAWHDSNDLSPMLFEDPPTHPLSPKSIVFPEIWV